MKRYAQKIKKYNLKFDLNKVAPLQVRFQFTDPPGKLPAHCIVFPVPAYAFLGVFSHHLDILPVQIAKVAQVPEITHCAIIEAHYLSPQQICRQSVCAG